MKHFVLACLVIVICRLLASYVFCTFDDAYISFRYAQNLVAGNGFVYNLQEKVLGTTAPLFALVGTIPLLLGLSVPKFFVVFNILCDLGAFYLVYRFFYNRNQALLVVFAFLFALDPAANRIAVGGMEANLFLCLSLLGITLYFNRKKLWAFLLLAVIYFLRPEAILLFSILLLYEGVTTGKLPWKYLACCLLIMALPLWGIYRFYGHVLPQSLITKSGWPPRPFSDLVSKIFFPHAFNYMLFPLAVTGIVKKLRANGYFLVAGLWVMAYAAAYCLRGPWILNWYIYIIEVIQLLFASLAVVEIGDRLRLSLNKFRLFLFIPLLAIPAWLFAFYYLGRSGVEQHVYAELKKDFIPEQMRGKVFFADDIGALGFYTGGYIFDGLALVTPRALHFRSMQEQIVHADPDYLFLYAAPGYVDLIDKDPALSGKYVFVKRYSPDGETGLPVREPGKTYDYRQDYILMKKREQPEGLYR
jgi:hypothetical protein